MNMSGQGMGVAVKGRLSGESATSTKRALGIQLRSESGLVGNASLFESSCLPLLLKIYGEWEIVSFLILES